MTTMILVVPLGGARGGRRLPIDNWDGGCITWSVIGDTPGGSGYGSCTERLTEGYFSCRRFLGRWFAMSAATVRVCSLPAGLRSSPEDPQLWGAQVASVVMWARR